MPQWALLRTNPPLKVKLLGELSLVVYPSIWRPSPALSENVQLLQVPRA